MSEIKNCEYYGYKVGDKFRIIDKEGVVSDIGNCNILTLSQDDGSDCPKFDGDNGNRGYASLCALEKIDEKTEWNGEGLPPVGMWVLSNGGGKFFYVGLNSIGDHVFEMDNGGITVFDSIEGFRPLPTKRDEWIEKAEQMYSKYGVAGIYDAGLAKDIEE